MTARSPQPLSTDERLQRLVEAIDRDGQHQFHEIIEMCADGRMQIHDRPNCACVTHLQVMADGSRVCNVVAGGGTLHGVSDMVRHVELFARANGCRAVRWQGRRGWDREARKHSSGYRPIATVYEKDLRNGVEPEGNH